MKLNLTHQLLDSSNTCTVLARTSRRGGSSEALDLLAVRPGRLSCRRAGWWDRTSACSTMTARLRKIYLDGGFPLLRFGIQFQPRTHTAPGYILFLSALPTSWGNSKRPTRPLYLHSAQQVDSQIAEEHIAVEHIVVVVGEHTAAEHIAVVVEHIERQEVAGNLQWEEQC